MLNHGYQFSPFLLMIKSSGRTEPEINFYRQGSTKTSEGLVRVFLTLSCAKLISKTHQILLEIPDNQATKH